jgi:hypothetical protein
MVRPSYAVKENHKTGRDVGLAELGIALLWELSNGWIGLLLGFHCLGDRVGSA